MVWMEASRLSQDNATRSQLSRYGNGGVTKMSHVDCNEPKDLREDVGSGGNPKGEDLIVGVSHRKAEELAMSGVAVDMEVHILHIENHEPGSGGGKVTIWKRNLQMNRFSTQRSKMGQREVHESQGKSQKDCVEGQCGKAEVVEEG